MRIVLTGITGQVGRALHPRLKKLGDVVPVGRDILDLSRPKMIQGALDCLGPDIIVNSAAYTAVDRAEDEQELVYTVNAESPGVIARWSAARSVPMVHFSTDYVFDGSSPRAWLEEDATNPLSVYGKSKLAGEQAVQHAGGVTLIVRTSWVYAATGMNFLRTMTQLARKESELRIVADQVGAPTPAAIIADAITAILADELDALRTKFAEAKGMLHLTASGETNWYGFALSIFDGLRARGIPLTLERVVPISSEEYSSRVRRPQYSCLDLTRLKRIFGIVPLRWNEALVPELDAIARDLQGTARSGY